MTKTFLPWALLATGAVVMQTAMADSAKLVNPGNGHTYKYYNSIPKTWADAKAKCVSLGAHLATITSAAENAWIVKKGLQGDSWTWIGATDEASEGTWLWLTGEAFSYSNWGGGEPNGGTSENYLMFYSDGTWNDLSGNNALAFLCEWDTLPPNEYSQVVALPDVNGNGSADFALLGETLTDYKLFILDGGTQAMLTTATIHSKAGYSVKSFTMVADNAASNPGIAVLLVKNSNQASVLQVYDAVTGVLSKTLALPAN